MIISLVTGLSAIAIMLWLAFSRVRAARTVALVLSGVNGPVAEAIAKIATPTLFLLIAIAGALFGVWLCIAAIV